MSRLFQVFTAKMIIEFTPEEMEQIERLALIRHHSAGIAVPPKYHSGTALDIDRLGAMGEAAVSKHFEWAVSTMMFTNRDDGRDFKTDVGSIQVKTREDANATLFIQTTRFLRADFGILCRKASPSSIDIVGWFSKAEWNKYSEVRSFSGANRYVMDRTRMHSNLAELLEEPALAS